MRLNLIRTSENSVTIEGDLTAANAGELAAVLSPVDPGGAGELALDLRALQIEGGPATAAAVDAIRELSSRAAKLTLIAAPQMLCHNLYRIGLLRQNVELVDMRQDEPAAY